MIARSTAKQRPAKGFSASRKRHSQLVQRRVEMLFEAVLEEAMKEIGEDSLYHKFLFVEMLYGGLDFYKLEEQEQRKFFDSTKRLLKRQEKEVSWDTQERLRLPLYRRNAEQAREADRKE